MCEAGCAWKYTVKVWLILETLIPNKLLWIAMDISGLSDKLSYDYTWDRVGGGLVFVFESKRILLLSWTVWDPILAHLS